MTAAFEIREIGDDDLAEVVALLCEGFPSGNGRVGFLERDDFSSNRHPSFTSDSRPSSQRSARPNANTGSGLALFNSSPRRRQ